MNSIYIYRIYMGFILSFVFSSPASSIDIQSYSGSVSVTPAGTPIFANSDDHKPLQKYNPDGSVNNYVWVDRQNRVLSQSLIFTPINSHLGREIKLCKVGSALMDCSNELKVTSFPLRQNRNLTRSARYITPFDSVWDYSSQFDENILLMSATSISTTTSFTYTGQPDNGPLPIGLIPRITDQDGNALVSLHIPLSASYSDFDVSYDAQVNLGLDTQIINFCPDLLVTDTFPPTISSDNKCISRLLRDGDIENSHSTYFYPPSPAQFDALFSHVSFTQTEDVTFNNESKVFVSAPRIDNSGQNLLEQYCSSIGDNIVPLDQSGMEVFASSGDFSPDNLWPGSTGYWTNQNDDSHPWNSFIPNGMGVVGGLTLQSGIPEYSAGANSYYRGFFVCKKL